MRSFLCLQYLHLILLTVAGPFLKKSLAAMITPIPQLPTPIILLSMGTSDGIPNRLIKLSAAPIKAHDYMRKIAIKGPCSQPPPFSMYRNYESCMVK